MKLYTKLPKLVKIGQREFKIILRGADTDPTLEDLCAYTMINADTIVIKNDLGVGTTRATVLHELLHAIRLVNENDFNSNIYKEKKNLTKEEWEHYFIGIYEDNLVGVLRDNPELVSYLLS